MTNGLKAIFDHEIATNNLSPNIVNMMNYIVANDDNFDAFHLVCAFLISNYTDQFLTSMGIRTVKLDLNKVNEIPYNKMN